MIFTAVVVTAYEVLLQQFADVSFGAMVFTAILIGLAGAVCSYAQYRLLLRIHRAAETTRQEAERGASLASLARELSSTLDPATVAQRTVESIVRLLQARSAILFRVEPASEALVTIASIGISHQSFPIGALLPSGAGATGQAVKQRQAVTTPDVLAEPGISRPADLEARLVASDLRAACVVPLILRGTVVGALRVSDTRGRQFTAYEVNLAQAFADHAAFSLENARLYAELDGHLHLLEEKQEQLIEAGKLAAVGQLVTGSPTRSTTRPGRGAGGQDRGVRHAGGPDRGRAPDVRPAPAPGRGSGGSAPDRRAGGHRAHRGVGRTRRGRDRAAPGRRRAPGAGRRGGSACRSPTASCSTTVAGSWWRAPPAGARPSWSRATRARRRGPVRVGYLTTS